MAKQNYSIRNLMFLGLITILSLILFIGAVQFFGNQSYPSARTRPQSHELTETEKWDAAERVLIKYFSELHDGNYEQAAEHFSGSYVALEVLNPEEPITDHAALLEDACEINAFACLNVMEIVSAEKLGTHEYQFEVTFQNNDGTQYEKETSDGTIISIFTITVLEKDGTFYVDQLPIHS